MATNKPQITIRPIIKEDQAEAAEIWRCGLQQTVDACASKLYLPLWVVQPVLGRLFDRLAENAMSSQGDVGPNGSNLCQHWKGDDRCMFVACLKGQNKSNKIVGLVGAKLGMKECDKATTEEQHMASVWRLSVSDSFRRKGIAEKLMLRAEEWAREKQCDTMTLITANPIASRFYTTKMHYSCGIMSFRYHKKL